MNEFILGVVTGLLMAIMFFFYYRKTLITKIITEVANIFYGEMAPEGSSLNPKNVKGASKEEIKTLLERLAEITKLQHDIAASVDAPSKNALHSKYKNDLVGQFKELNDEKLATIDAILSSGYDPLVGIQSDTGEIRQIKLSEYRGTIQDTTPPPPPGSKGKKKLFVVKGSGDSTH